MPLDNLFGQDDSPDSGEASRKTLYETFGVVENPFPAASQTSGHPHRPTAADKAIDSHVKEFVEGDNTKALAITASQGIGKTNLLNTYEEALERALSGRGFFVIRYVADPEPSFDSLVRSVFEQLGEEHLTRVAKALAKADDAQRATARGHLRVHDVGTLIDKLLEASADEEKLRKATELAHQWFLGFPVRKAHRAALGVSFRLDTVESKTRALRDVVFLSVELGELKGIFLLLDELEKQDGLSKTMVLRYLSGLRALIDALPKFLFLMAALTPDALRRYREMLPALKGRLANTIELEPIRTQDEALEYYRFYLRAGRTRARQNVGGDWTAGDQAVLEDPKVVEIFDGLRPRSLIEGIRQRDFLDQLHQEFSRRATG